MSTKGTRSTLILLSCLLLLLAEGIGVVSQPPLPGPLPPLVDPVFVDPSVVSPLKVISIAGKTPSMTSIGAPTVRFSVVELEMEGFDGDGPPQITVYDDSTNEVFFETSMKPTGMPGDQPAQDMTLPIQLAYDRNPWSNTSKEPRSVVSRIEVSNLHGKQTFYVRLKAGVFVVPVVWHTVLEPGGANYVAEITNGVAEIGGQKLGAVFDLFMTAPDVDIDYASQYGYGVAQIASDMNTIWGQAGIQFHLMTATYPYPSNSYYHFVQSATGETSSAKTPCVTGWSPYNRYNSPEAVDIYAVYTLTSNGSAIAGLGNCFTNGSVYIAAGKPGGSYDYFTSGTTTVSGARAVLVAHEFGHFLGGLGHMTDYYSLMNPFLAGWKLSQQEINTVRQQIKNRGSYFEAY